MRGRLTVVMASLGIVSMIAGCASGTSSELSRAQLDWCRANSTTTVFDAAVNLGYTRQEMTLLFDDVQVKGWPATEQDARYVRACQLAFTDR